MPIEESLDSALGLEGTFNIFKHLLLSPIVGKVAIHVIIEGFSLGGLYEIWVTR